MEWLACPLDPLGLGGFLHFEAISRRAMIGPLPAGAEHNAYSRPSKAAFPGNFLSKIDGFWLPRRCAGDTILARSRRFEAALLGREGLLFMRRPLGDGVGIHQDLRQIQ